MYEAISQDFLSQTGVPLATVRVAEVIAQGGRITYYAKEISLADSLSKARADVARVIADQIIATLGDRFAFIGKTYLGRQLPATLRFAPRPSAGLPKLFPRLELFTFCYKSSRIILFSTVIANELWNTIFFSKNNSSPKN